MAVVTRTFVPLIHGALLALSVAVADAADPLRGELEYERSCARCHGTAGRVGSGDVLDPGRASHDLALLAARNGGRFPVFEVYEILAGERPISVGGQGDPHTWWTRYGAELGRVPLAIGIEADKDIQGRTLELIAYLQTLQIDTPWSGQVGDVPASSAVHPVSRSARLNFEPAYEVPGELIDTLVTWIERNSEYRGAIARRYKPPVFIVDSDAVFEYEGRSMRLSEKVLGLYDTKFAHILLIDNWDPRNVWHVSTLLHELVHYMQHLDRDWACWRRSEREAYRLQEAWLREQGVESDFNWPFVSLISSCSPGDPAPSLARHLPFRPVWHNAATMTHSDFGIRHARPPAGIGM